RASRCSRRTGSPAGGRRRPTPRTRGSARTSDGQLMSITFFFTQLALAVPLMAAYALFALGIVLIYRASRVLNLAHGVMAMLPSYVVVELRAHGIPMPAALLAGVASGALLGALVELVFIRRLRRVSETAQ